MADPGDLDTRFAAAMLRYTGLLRQAIGRTCPRDMGLDLDDIEQDARVRVWRAIESERPIAHPASFFYRVGVTATLDAMRRARTRRDVWLQEPDDGARGAEAAPPGRRGPDQEEAVLQRETVDAVFSGLAELPDNRRRAVALHLQGLTTQEIADLLGWTEPKARNLLHRGMKVLREWLRVRGVEHAG